MFSVAQRRLLSSTTRVAASNSAAASTASTAVAAATDDRRVFQAELLSATRCRIFRPANTPTQNGSARANHWRIDFDTQDKWENSLMGWASSADPVQALSLKFLTKEDAILFAERQGYDYWVDLPKESGFKVKQYSSNFKYSPGKLRYQHTK
ncbi:hypothetical protein BCR33DRAFT_856219 [Rhizoclosmatium globosum]|uniref:NADH dehydrogenase [ubiquinone] iron-sulfur protein 4, mitochondrial n=1 Tax=Rhizoclosmatium globosum TaxID=329046 RepID=A0A1Y2BFH7_9FUNG|nr:hypothetical protein BCR33DRAFT_856219 [Rhizoclosmatium globosum]|eukprot:ORY33571.1 hypothetical protein BCR33DRAFT_856219 [Rhizoclosmatium globosum]